MITWLKTKIQNFRIEIDFLAHDKDCRVQYLKDADVNFSTKTMAAEISQLTSLVLADAAKQFSQSMGELSTSILTHKSHLAGQQGQLKVFMVDYKKEIAARYAMINGFYVEKDTAYLFKKQLHVEIKEAFAEKDAAYANLNEIKENINSWYAKSERSTWLLGNKGKKIPNHAFFSQSHGDLSCLKSDRADAQAYIQSYKSTISELKQNIGATNEQITDIKNHLAQLKKEVQQLKKGRQTMFNLKNKAIIGFHLISPLNKRSSYCY